MSTSAAQPPTSSSGSSLGLGLYLTQRVMLLTQDGRLLLGQLQGFDNMGSVILSSTIERIFTAVAEGEEGGGVEEVELGLYVLRGDAICLIGDIDTAKDASIDWGTLNVDGIPDVRHS